MRIAQVNDIASVASEITAGLRTRGHEVTLFQPRLVGGALAWWVKPVVGPLRAAEWLQLVRAIRRGCFDITHIHYAYLGIVGILGRFPFMIHCHGSDVRDVSPFTRYFTDRSLRQAAYVFYATPDLADYVEGRRFDAEFLPNPVDTETFQPTRSARESTQVLIICALDDIKGAPRLFQACRRLARLRPDIRVTAIAGGRHAEHFAGLPNVTLVPRQKRSDLPKLIGQHGVVIGQAYLGAIGMAELEAMACARPLISWFTYQRAYPEPPPLLRALDGRDISDLVIRLVDSPGERERLGDAGREWVKRYHGLDSAAARVEEVAEAIVAEQRALARC